MSSITDQNKEITKEFFEALSSGSDKYLDFYTDESIIWTAGNNSIGGIRTKKEVVSFAQNILSAFPSRGLFADSHGSFVKSPIFSFAITLIDSL